MRAAAKPNVSAPSLSVLRFLRSQSEQNCFFDPSTRAIACQTSPRQGRKVVLGSVAHALPSVRRHLATSPPRQAFVESSLLNLDFLRPCSERGSSRFASNNPPTVFGFPGENSKSSRSASTDTQPLWKRQWKERSCKDKHAFKTSGSSALPGFLDDATNTSLGRRKTGKGANELKLRCTEFDENGNVTFMDGEFKKSELIAKVCSISL